LPVEIDLLPGLDAGAWLEEHRQGRMHLPNLLAEHLPRRFAHEWCALYGGEKLLTRPISELGRRDLDAIAARLNAWSLMPAGTLGFAKAEITLGGVSTVALSSKTMEATAAPGLYFIGEVVDVTGWLGGYNFQWAWSSGWVAGQFV
jgi:predicted flavoprotein YhiN